MDTSATATAGLNLAFVTETFPPEVNGVAMTVGHLVSGLRARGHQVEVLRPRRGRDERGSAGELCLPGLPLPGYPGVRIGLPAGRRLAQRWAGQRPDLVHVVTEGPLGWSAVQTARRLGIPVTSGFHTNFDHYTAHYGLGWLRPAMAAYLRMVHRRTQATLVPTAALAAELAGAGIPGVRVLGRGIDTELFNPARRRQDLRQTWGVDRGGPVCLYVGRLAPEKNLPLVEKSFAAIRRHYPGARMVWVGDGPSAEQLTVDHPDHHFSGVRLGSDLAAHYASADLFLFPSLSETYGNVVPEAMASGLPVLAYRSAAAAELVVNGDNGVVVSPGDEAAYIAAALELLAQPDRLVTMGERARQAMLGRSWSAIVQGFESLVRSLINEASVIET